jgi:hypothetical protein
MIPKHEEPSLSTVREDLMISLSRYDQLQLLTNFYTPLGYKFGQMYLKSGGFTSMRRII